MITCAFLGSIYPLLDRSLRLTVHLRVKAMHLSYLCIREEKDTYKKHYFSEQASVYDMRSVKLYMWGMDSTVISWRGSMKSAALSVSLASKYTFGGDGGLAASWSRRRRPRRRRPPARVGVVDGEASSRISSRS